MSVFKIQNHIQAGSLFSNSASAKTNKWTNFASIVCSRESTYRTMLDITAFDLPIMGADAFRGMKKFLESALEAACGTVMVLLAPTITSIVGKILGNSYLPKKSKKDTLSLLCLNMNELKDLETFKKGLERMKKEESEDKSFIASLYKNTNQNEKAKKYEDQVKNIESFAENINKESDEYLKDLVEKTRKLKKATLIGESFIEGGWWGGFGLISRLFRKYILKEDRFTGTINYTSEAESQQLGESGEISLFEKTVGIGSVFISPTLNSFLMNKLEDDEKVKKSKFLQTVKSQYDMTHGVYPKLGLLFSITTIPKWTGSILTSQGWIERGERILKLLTVLPSWWLGHRVTNGLIAQKADEKLSKKYNVDKGILIEPESLIKEGDKNENFFVRTSKKFPEPARIHHIFKTIESNTNLDEETKTKFKKEAEEKHAECLYKGFALHSLMVWVINMAVNQVTKIRAQMALGK